MTDWLEPQPITVPEDLRRAVGGHPLVAEALLRRGVGDAAQARAFLDPSLYQPAPLTELPGLAAAVDRLAQAVSGGERILVWGDFDVDGLTATATLVENLRAHGGLVSYHIPTRGEGHGVQPAVLRAALAESPAEIILTCDTGISAHEAALVARNLGVDFLITDHHALPARLPEAHTIVNPCFLPDDHPLRTLPGAGCAYLLAAALGAKLGTDLYERSLDLLALAIVADVATLQGDVRYYLQRGLAALRSTERLGLRAVLETAGLDPSNLDEEHIGFAIAPRLNALGRLGDARAGAELLLTTDLTRARTIASEMEGLNNRRQLLTSQVLQAAGQQIERDSALKQAPVLIVGHPTWPSGIVGLVAGRLCERYGKPAIVLSTPADGPSHGSARSVEGVDIAAAIADCGDLLIAHGGHPKAAGLSLRPENLPELRRRLALEVARQAAMAPPPPPLALDGVLELAQATPELARDLHRLAPFGPGHPPLVLLARRLRVAAQAAVGRTGEHRRLYLRDEAGREHKVFWWQSAGQPLPEGIFDLAYSLRPSNYQGRDEVTVQWVASRVLEPAAELPVVAGPSYEVFDHRDDPAPRVTLDMVRELEPVLVWAEGAAPEGLETVDRNTAGRADGLAVWSAPPGPRELAALLDRVRPRRVHLFALPAETDEPAGFLRRLLGLARYAQAHYDGRIDEELLSRMAAQTAQRQATVRCGLRWLAAHGKVSLAQEAGAWRVGPGSGHVDPAAAEGASRRLTQLLRETAAYRAYARQADAHVLLAVGGQGA